MHGQKINRSEVSCFWWNIERRSCVKFENAGEWKQSLRSRGHAGRMTSASCVLDSCSRKNSRGKGLAFARSSVPPYSSWEAPARCIPRGRSGGSFSCSSATPRNAAFRAGRIEIVKCTAAVFVPCVDSSLNRCMKRTSLVSK